MVSREIQQDKHGWGRGWMCSAAPDRVWKPEENDYVSLLVEFA